MPLKLTKKGKIWHLSGTVNGRRYRESTGTTSREHAEAKRKEIERDLEDRAYKHTSSFADAVAIYVEKGGEKRFLGPLMDQFEATPLRGMTPAVVSAFSQDKYRHLEASTIKRHLYVPLNAVMQAAHDAGLCPSVKFQAPKVKVSPVDYADDTWLRMFLDYAHPRIALTVLFLTSTAARVGEACQLRVGDIDIARGAAILRKTKNGKSRRVILSPLLTDALSRWITEKHLFDSASQVFGYANRWSVNQAGQPPQTIEHGERRRRNRDRRGNGARADRQAVRKPPA